MGSLATSNYRQQNPVGNTPPALVSPTASSYLSVVTPSESRTADTVATTPGPMSAHDDTATAELSPGLRKMGASSHSRPEPLSSASARQQLPSLSSLFGPPTSRPLQSPASDAHTSYPTTSPLDRPRTTLDRPSAGSYFAHHGSAPSFQPRSTYDDRQNGVERQASMYPLKRTYSESMSAGHREGAVPRYDSHAESEGSGRWTVANEQSRQEYTFGSREQHFRSQQEHFRLQFPGSKQLGYGEQRHVRHQPPTPTSTAASEGVVSKDGLGPKIWTGTHFLPRFVRATEVPGEGMCFFYDDGSHCKTVIDGEAVNAHWGVTKAGKPRKRLAIACMTCREKKIKCDPDFPRCVQCEKFGRVCRFKNAPRGGHNTSPETPPAELDSFRKSGAPPADYRVPGSDTGSPVSPRTALPYVSPEASAHKRMKLESEKWQGPEDRSEVASQPMKQTHSEYESRSRTWDSPQISDDVLYRAWQTDPYLTDAQSILAVLTHFFAQIENTMILRLLPQESTMAWAANSPNRKAPEDLMLLYSMLAMGVALSDGPRSIAFEYAQVAHYAQKTLRNDCLQLVQTRIILALYYISMQHVREAGDLVAAAAATSASLQLRVEIDDAVEGQRASYPLNLTRAGFAESRRRTMWSLFMLERLWGLFPHQPAILNAEDICIRLPVNAQSFERQIEENAPLFDPYEPVGPAVGNSSLDLTGYWVEIVHLWSSCQSALSRQMRRSSWADNESAKLRSYLNRVDKWRSGLPKSLALTPQNLEDAMSSGKAGAFCSMHLLYHHASIVLARFGKVPHQMSSAEQTAAVSDCRKHSYEILEILRIFGSAHDNRRMKCGPMPSVTAALVSEAVDILTCGGMMANIEGVISALHGAMPALRSTGASWNGQQAMASFVDEKLSLLHQIQNRGADASSPRPEYRILGSDREAEWRLMTGLRSMAKEVDVLSSISQQR